MNLNNLNNFIIIFYINVIWNENIDKYKFGKIFAMKAMNKFIYIVVMDAVEVVWKISLLNVIIIMTLT